MASFLPKDVNPYTNKCIKSKLCEHFEDSVTFIEVPGKASTVLFKERVNKILKDACSEPGPISYYPNSLIQEISKIIR